MHTFSSIVSCIIESKNIEDIIENFTDFLISNGVKHYNYTTLKQPMMYHNYDKSWCERYATREYCEVDPAIIIVKIYNQMFTWQEACSEMKDIHITQAQKMLLLQMENSVNSEEMNYGVCIPLFAYPFGQHGFYLAFSSKKPLLDKPFLSQITGICSIFNNAFQNQHPNSVNNSYTKFPFSQRERLLIGLIYNGKERFDIASMMDISINTVDTITKRIFIKMRVNTKTQLMTKILLNGWTNVFVHHNREPKQKQ